MELHLDALAVVDVVDVVVVVDDDAFEKMKRRYDCFFSILILLSKNLTRISVKSCIAQQIGSSARWGILECLFAFRVSLKSTYSFK